MTWVRSADGWAHRPWWKVAVNTVLRLLQPGLERKLVVATVCEQAGDAPPVVVGYRLQRVRHLPALPRALAQPRRWRLRIPVRGSLPPAGAEPVAGDDLESAIKAEREVARDGVYAALERRVLPALLPCAACKGDFSMRLRLDDDEVRWGPPCWTCDSCGEELTAAQVSERVGGDAWRYRYSLPRVKMAFPAAHIYEDGL